MAKLFKLSNCPMSTYNSLATVAFLGNHFGLQHSPVFSPLWTLVNPEKTWIGLDLSTPEGIKQYFWRIIRDKEGIIFVKSERPQALMNQHYIFGDDTVRNRWNTVSKILIY